MCPPPRAVTVVTEDPTPGQAVTGSIPTAPLANESTLRPEHNIAYKNDLSVVLSIYQIIKARINVGAE